MWTRMGRKQAENLRDYTSIVSRRASSGISGSRASISSAPTFRDSIRSSYSRFWALTPGRSTNHPTHQSPSCLITALYFTVYSFLNGTSRSLHILRASRSTISECLGTWVRRCARPQIECRRPSRINSAPFRLSHRINSDRFMGEIYGYSSRK